MADYDRDFKLTKCNEHHRDWSSLPAGILCDISSRLLFLDYYSFADVCTSWRSSMAPLSPPMPFIFLRKLYFTPRPFCSLLNITNNLSNNFHMPILGGKVCIGSQYGWLFLVDNTVCVISLYNPFSQQEIKLPTHYHIVYPLFSDEAVPLSNSDFMSKGFCFKKVVLSCAPTSTAPFVAAAALFDNGAFMYMRDGEYYWKLSSSYGFADITFWKGMCVGATIQGGVYKLDLNVPEPKFEFMGMGEPRIFYKHLVNLNDNLLLVWWLNDPETRITNTVKVLQLDVQQLTWSPVDDLCGHSLFLGTAHSLSLPSQHLPGLKDNLVYFIHDLWGDDPGIDTTNWKRDIGVFNIKDGTYEICPLPNIRLPRSTSAFWYVPPLYEVRKEALSCNKAYSN